MMVEVFPGHDTPLLTIQRAEGRVLGPVRDVPFRERGDEIADGGSFRVEVELLLEDQGG